MRKVCLLLLEIILINTDRIALDMTKPKDKQATEKMLPLNTN
jgi:hypothetical protein